ncbi:MAG: DUF86 domain-containing protein [Planctomycetaceae bacterium]
MRSDRERLLDVQEDIERIEKYSARGRDAFEQDELIQTWIVHHLQIIGEATRALSEQTRDAHPNIPWKQINGMRNILVHHYFGIDVPVVWSVVENDLQPLKNDVQQILDSQPDDSDS